MATWQLRAGSSTLTFDGNPFWLAAATGVGLGMLRRLTERGPLQQGASDVGYRYDPRTINLVVAITASTLALMDAARDDLAEMLLPDQALALRCTRDDGEVRQIDVRCIGLADAPAQKPERLAGLQRVVVQLQAAEPWWYDPTALEVVFDLPAPEEDWYLGGGAVDAGNVLDHVTALETPATHTITAVDSANPWSIVIFGNFYTNVSADYTPVYANDDGSPTGSLDMVAMYARLTSPTYLTFALPGYAGGQGEARTDEDRMYSTVYAPPYVFPTNVLKIYLNDGTVATDPIYSGLVTVGLSTRMLWRDEGYGSVTFPGDAIWGAVYNIALSSAQRAAIYEELSAPTGLAQTLEVTYGGTVDEYPVIEIEGPVGDPVLVNETAGTTLDLTGTTLGIGEILTIDCRYGHKTVVDQTGTNRIAALSAESDLATFRLLATPNAAAGLNTLTLSGTGITPGVTETRMTYYERFGSL